jgi:hypothetical protein
VCAVRKTGGDVGVGGATGGCRRRCCNGVSHQLKPLIRWSDAATVRLGLAMGVPLVMTHVPAECCP